MRQLGNGIVWGCLGSIAVIFYLYIAFPVTPIQPVNPMILLGLFVTGKSFLIADEMIKSANEQPEEAR